MNSAFSTLVVLGIFSSVIACGGAVASNIGGGPQPDPNSDGGISPGIEVDGGTTDTDGGVSPPATCGSANQLDVPALRACVPEELQFDDAFTLQLAVDETGLSCVTCTAKVSDNTIRIELDGATCPDGQVCNNSNATVSCTIPALVSGPYTLFFTHGDNLDQLSINASSGGPTSCSLAPAQALDPANYDNSCKSDFDCTLVPGGDPCAVCNCAGLPLAESSAPAYENDLAFQQAECPEVAGSGPEGCGCPASQEPKCINNTCQAAPLTNN